MRAMEARLDQALNAERAMNQALDQFEALPQVVRQLEEYYTGGEWLRDFEADEQGLLPKDLKRGVLSEDGMDEALTEYRSLLLRMLEAVSRAIRDGGI